MRLRVKGQLREVLTFASTYLISIGILLEKSGSTGFLFPNLVNFLP